MDGDTPFSTQTVTIRGLPYASLRSKKMENVLEVLPKQNGPLHLLINMLLTMTQYYST